MTLKNTLLSLALLGALSATAAQAAERSYSFVEASYVNLGDQGSTDTFDGFGLRGSIEIGDHWYFAGDWRSTSASFTGYSADFDVGTIGAGYHTSVTDNVDFFADLSYTTVSIDVLGANVDENGFRARLGFRGNLSDNFEGTLGVSHTDLPTTVGGGDTALLIGGQWQWNQTWGLVGEAEIGDETLYQIGIRASFDL